MEDVIVLKPGSDSKIMVNPNPPAAFTEKRRMILNPDRKIVDAVIKRIFMCGGKCPCQPVDETKDTRCPCSDFTERGNCHCRLFVEAPDGNE